MSLLLLVTACLLLFLPWRTTSLRFSLLSGATSVSAPILQGSSQNNSSTLVTSEAAITDDSDSQIGGRNLLLGKDRELFYTSIDLRRAWDKLTDRSSWISLFRRLVKVLSGTEDDQLMFKEVAVDLMVAIRKVNPDARIKLFQGTMKQAEQFARKTGRFIVLYVEDGTPGSRSTLMSEYFRKALSDNYLADAINDKFVFYAGSSAHSPTYNIAKLLGYTKRDLPLFAILTPTYVEGNRSGKKKNDLAVALRFLSTDIDSSKILRFLLRVLEVHGPSLAAKKREFDELLETSTVSGDDARRRSLIFRQLPPEPPRHASGALTVSIVLSGEKKLERRFLSSEPALSVILWADANAAFNPKVADLRSTISGKVVILRQSELVSKPTCSLADMGIKDDSILVITKIK